MQKPGVGFDFVQRLSARTGDIGVLAVQARLVYDQSAAASFNLSFTTPIFASSRDSPISGSGTIGPPSGCRPSWTITPCSCPTRLCSGTASTGIGASGLERDFAWGGVAASLTAGSGMPLYLKGNFLAAARVFEGVLARDNFSVGLSLARGNDSRDHGLHSCRPRAGRLDLGRRRRVLRLAELREPRRSPRRPPCRGGTFLLFWRSGLSLLEEGRLKIEAQPVLMRRMGAWTYSFASGRPAPF